MTEGQIIEQLLKANVRLTEQLVSLAQSVISAAQRVPATSGAAEVPERRKSPTSDLSTLDDWSDIADASGNPFGSPERHVREEEEDARYAASQGLIGHDQLREIAEKANLISTEIHEA